MSESLVPLNTDGLTEAEQEELKALFKDELNKNMDDVQPRMPVVALSGGFIVFPPDKEHPDEWTGKELVGTIIKKQAVRSYYDPTRPEDDDNKMPDCFSSDCKTPAEGVENPISPTCAGCKFDKFGSAVDDSGKPGAGKMCREKKRLWVLVDGNAIPYIMHVPLTSIKPFDAFVTNLTAAGIPILAVKTRMKSSKESRGNREWTTLEFERAGLHDAKTFISMRSLAEKVEPEQAPAQKPEEEDDNIPF